MAFVSFYVGKTSRKEFGKIPWVNFESISDHNSSEIPQFLSTNDLFK